MPVIVEEVSVEAIPEAQARPAIGAALPPAPASDGTAIYSEHHELPRLLAKLRDRAERVRAH
jgi:hypothetical protein